MTFEKFTTTCTVGTSGLSEKQSTTNLKAVASEKRVWVKLGVPAVSLFD